MCKGQFYDGLSIIISLVGMCANALFIDNRVLSRVFVPSIDTTTPESIPHTLRYVAVDLGFPEGAVRVEARAASPNFKYVVGVIVTRTVTRAFLWKDGKFQYLSPRQSVAWSVNNAGDVVGEIAIDSIESCAVVWKKGREYRLFEDRASSRAQWIDNAGNIYGTRVDSNAKHVWRTYIRDVDGSTTYLDQEHRNSFFRCANQNKQVVFKLAHREPNDAKNDKDVVWLDGKTHELPPLQMGQRCLPNTINERGDAVGTCWCNNNIPMPIIWKNNIPSSVGPPGIKSGMTTGINQKGDMIGVVSIKDLSDNVPFLIHDGKFYEINDILENDPKIRRPLQLSNSNIVLAVGFDGKVEHSYLLIPQQ